ncbi:hypothetical protein [Streptomyces triticirhizae]|uniref:LPXTG cell wall anchor domain-containing protein n=1 Tax=Streptomyces triticirhizae TaxID=2483353 RepID=A0A3M2L0J9_9ACTN|nr:hypothetical protein [Streptomyces triticirhizae]RMI31071.1 hypothetical protein EBN88_26255 [Streptomyces triticirhizae]
MRLWVGIALAGVALLTVATAFAAAAVANDRGAGRGAERGAEHGAERAAAGEGDRRFEGRTERRADGERVAEWRIVDQPTTRWQGRGSERLARGAGGAAPGGEIVPVMPLGAGLTCLGLGLGLFGYRLRQG